MCKLLNREEHANGKLICRLVLRFVWDIGIPVVFLGNYYGGWMKITKWYIWTLQTLQ